MGRVSAPGPVRCLVVALWWCSAGLALAVDPPQPYLKEPSYTLCPHLLGGSESFRDRLAAAGQGVECFYNYQFTPAIRITPDLQYVVPALRSADPSLIAGVRALVSF